nr:RNA polymerase sigma-70 factor [Hufsiella ginkgonis]
MHAYAQVIVRDAIIAEEIVQQLFLRLWEKRRHVNVQGPIRAYLYKCVYNDSLNHLKHEKVRARFEDHTQYSMKNEAEEASGKLEASELQQKISEALNELPEQCRTIFQLSRFEELKYREIADFLGISVKTVENQMGKALRLMRLKLADFLPLIALIIDRLFK